MACPVAKDVATSGPHDRFHLYWEALCSSVGLDVEDLPWLVTAQERRRIRYYINSGVFLVRRDSAVVDHYLGNLRKLMDDGICSSTDAINALEQIALSLAVFTAGATWRELPGAYNFSVSGIPSDDCLDGLETARIVHYHLAMSPRHRDDFLAYFRRHRPDRLEWLNSKGALAAWDAPLIQRLVRRVLREYRERKLRRYLARCRVIDTSPHPESTAALD